MTVKLNEIKWEVASDRYSEKYEIDEDFDSKKDAIEYINGESMAKHFYLIKTTITRTIIKKINLKRPRTCHGGWYKGHNVSQIDLDNETKNPFCIHCGYKLRRVTRNYGNVSWVAVNPLVHKEDEDAGSKK